jgi:hypothetical protein
VVTELKRRGLWPKREGRPAKRVRPPRRRDEDEVARSRYAADLWNEAVDLTGTIAERYLRKRVPDISDELIADLTPRALRFHANCPFGPGERYPCLIAAFRPVRNDDEAIAPRAIHRIALTLDGSKIEKKMLGPVSGCAVKIDPDDVVEEGLAICEGIETAIAIRVRDICPPIWALGSAMAIAKFAPIPGIEALTIFADHDESGLAAAEVGGRLWQRDGAEVRINKRPAFGKDGADG